MPARSLADEIANSGTGSSHGGSSSKQQSATERVQWIEAFTDKERFSEFCEATDPAGHFGSSSSSGHSEYQDRLRAIALRKEGMEKAEIAASLGRSAKFVQAWWRKEPQEVPRPPGVHEYLKVEYWRDIEIVRGFGRGLGIYEDALASTEWIDQMADGPGFRDGGSRLKYDKEGRMRPNGTQYARDGLVPGRVPKLDALVQRMLAEQGIDDRVLKRPGMLWYPDGNAAAIPHRHEAWTALFSFGSPRILTIDNHPVLLRDGDLIIFGTQRHGVPKMCNEGATFNDYGGRMSIVFFFMPTGQQAKNAEPWRAILDQGDTGPSQNFAAMRRDVDLSGAAEARSLRSGPLAEALEPLTALGFGPREAAAALRACDNDVERAAEILLAGGAEVLLSVESQDEHTAMPLSHGGSGQWEPALRSQAAARKAQVVALRRRLAELQHSRCTPASSCVEERTARQLASSTSSIAAESASAAVDHVDSDAALALRLQEEEEESALRDPTASAEEWEERAILEELQELEQFEAAGEHGIETLRAQFAQYEEMLDAEDAEEWDGRGDLMVRHWRREHLQIEQQEPTTVYGLGCGALQERAFFELLSLHSIRVVYDLRPDPEAAVTSFFKSHSLEISCKSRGIKYRHVALGRESAYGILKHLREDEGRNTLAELVWHARRRRSAFLGVEEDWRRDHRLAIAARLREAGHTVLHVAADGSVEAHPSVIDIPDHLSGEEARLRILEKRRLAGEGSRPQKSGASRSTEAVALKLAQPRQEIDAGAELRKATTQRELCNIQRRLADMQRRSEEPDAQRGLGPKLVGVNKWVKAEAAQQRENLAAGKTKDGKERPAVNKSVAGPALPSPSRAAGDEATEPSAARTSAAAAGVVGTSQAFSPDHRLFMVECFGCSISFPWETLAEFDGRCAGCARAASTWCEATPTSPKCQAADLDRMSGAGSSSDSRPTSAMFEGERDTGHGEQIQLGCCPVDSRDEPGGSIGDVCCHDGTAKQRATEVKRWKATAPIRERFAEATEANGVGVTAERSAMPTACGSRGPTIGRWARRRTRDA